MLRWWTAVLVCVRSTTNINWTVCVCHTHTHTVQLEANVSAVWLSVSIKLMREPYCRRKVTAFHLHVNGCKALLKCLQGYFLFFLRGFVLLINPWRNFNFCQLCMVVSVGSLFCVLQYTSFLHTWRQVPPTFSPLHNERPVRKGEKYWDKLKRGNCL